MKNSAVLRRVTAVLLAFGAAMTVLIMSTTTAGASSAYPPTPPCAGISSPAGLGIGGQGTGNPCGGVAAVSTHRSQPLVTDQPRSTTTSGTASTGFDSLMASLIAAALLAGGTMFVVAGRRRRHS